MVAVALAAVVAEAALRAAVAVPDELPVAEVPAVAAGAPPVAVAVPAVAAAQRLAVPAV